MATGTPESYLETALSSYLQTNLSLVAGLQCVAVNEWPEPSVNMSVTTSKVALAVVRAGNTSTGRDRLGKPRVLRLLPGIFPACTLRYEYGVVEQAMTVGLWAYTGKMRDDVDYLLDGLLNQPHWTTVSPVVATTIAANVSAGAAVMVTPASMNDISFSTRLLIDVGGSAESVFPIDIFPTGFTATLTKPHLSGMALVEAPARQSSFGETGLSLRIAPYFNQIARYDGFEHYSVLDSPDNSQRQEWRSVRMGLGKVSMIRDVPGIQQGRMFLSGQFAPIDISRFTATSPTPIVTRPF